MESSQGNKFKDGDFQYQWIVSLNNQMKPVVLGRNKQDKGSGSL